MRGLAAAAVWLATATGVAAQSPAPLPAASPAAGSFPVAVDQVTVDVVVANRRGEPVTGLTEQDFTLLEDGRPQKVVSFDVVRPGPSTAASGGSETAAWPVATNTERAAGRGRTFVILFDNLHMSPLGARSAKSAVAAFLEKGARDDDSILLAATGENFWWTAPAGAGRPDFLAALKDLEGRRFLAPAGDRLTDYEAVQISVYRDVRVAASVAARFDRYGGETSRQGMQEAQQQNVAQSQIDMYVDQRALEAYTQLRHRLEVTLGLLERTFKALEASHDRKTVILVSEGFASDPSNRHLRTVAEAARRANAALYFIDTRGLETLSTAYSVEFGPAMENGDRLSAIADVGRDGDGAAALADETGGFSVRSTNDFASGIVRIGRESESYYLLGYVPAPRPADGKFHKIDVRVRGRSLVVRARKGYYDAGGPGSEPAATASAAAASSAAAPAGAEPAPRERSDPALQRALDSPSPLAGIPLRMSAYVLAPAGDGGSQIVVAADADVSKIAFGENAANAELDTLLVVAARQGGLVQRVDRKVELQRRAHPPGNGPVWYSFVRDFSLGAGRHQAKLVVRDIATGKVGTVTATLEVPDPDTLHLSSPLLTDTLQKDASGAMAPTVLARREFRHDGSLYCLFEVFGAAKGKDGRPHVQAGHALRQRGGALVGRAEPTQVTPTSIGALSRLIQIPLSVAPPGQYELVITVRDDISGRSVERVEPFVITAAP
jgi:VWFA-related protein